MFYYYYFSKQQTQILFGFALSRSNQTKWREESSNWSRVSDLQLHAAGPDFATVRLRLSERVRGDPAAVRCFVRSFSFVFSEVKAANVKERWPAIASLQRPASVPIALCKKVCLLLLAGPPLSF